MIELDYPAIVKSGDGFEGYTESGEAVRLGNSAGLRYLAILLDPPGRSIRCSRLLELASGEDLRGVEGQVWEHGSDSQAFRQYRRELARLEECQRRGDTSPKTARDIEFLRNHIRGENRQTISGDAEKMRKSVKVAIDRAMANLRAVAPEVAARITVVTGHTCAAYLA